MTQINKKKYKNIENVEFVSYPYLIPTGIKKSVSEKVCELDDKKDIIKQ